MIRLISVVPTLLLALFPAVAGDYTLTVKDDRVRLDAANASLVEVVEELGSLLEIEVYANLRDDVRIDVQFEDLEISDAIREICGPVGYVESPDPDSGRIARLVLISGGKSVNRAEARREPLAPRPKAPPALPRVTSPEADAARTRKDQAGQSADAVQKAQREKARRAIESAKDRGRDQSSERRDD